MAGGAGSAARAGAGGGAGAGAEAGGRGGDARGRAGDRALGAAVHREPAVGAEAVLAAVDRRAARAGGDAGVAQDGHRLVLGEGAFERAQLDVDLAERRELGEHERVVALAEAVEVVDQTAEVAVGELARLAQEARAAAHAPALAEAGRTVGRVLARGRLHLRRRTGGLNILHRPTNAIRRHGGQCARRRRRARPGAGRRTARRGRAPGSATRRAQVGLERRAPGAELERRAERPRDAAQRLGVDADGRGQHRHVAGERLEHRQAEALVPGWHQNRVDGVEPQRRARGIDAAQDEQLDVDRARQLEREVVALDRPGRVGREQQVGRLGIEAQLVARLRPGDRVEALEVDAARQHLRPGARAGARQFLRQRARDGRQQVDPAERGAGDHPRAGVAHVVAVDGQRAHARGNRKRRPGGEAVVRVHDVERRARGPAAERRGAAVAAAQIAGRPRERAGAGGNSYSSISRSASCRRRRSAT